MTTSRGMHCPSIVICTTGGEMETSERFLATCVPLIQVSMLDLEEAPVTIGRGTKLTCVASGSATDISDEKRIQKIAFWFTQHVSKGAEAIFSRRCWGDQTKCGVWMAGQASSEAEPAPRPSSRFAGARRSFNLF